MPFPCLDQDFDSVLLYNLRPDGVVTISVRREHIPSGKCDFLNDWKSIMKESKVNMRSIFDVTVYTKEWALGMGKCWDENRFLLGMTILAAIKLIVKGKHFQLYRIAEQVVYEDATGEIRINEISGLVQIKLPGKKDPGECLERNLMPLQAPYFETIKGSYVNIINFLGSVSNLYISKIRHGNASRNIISVYWLARILGGAIESHFKHDIIQGAVRAKPIDKINIGVTGIRRIEELGVAVDVNIDVNGVTVRESLLKGILKIFLLTVSFVISIFIYSINNWRDEILFEKIMDSVSVLTYLELITVYSAKALTGDDQFVINTLKFRKKVTYAEQLQTWYAGPLPLIMRQGLRQMEPILSNINNCGHPGYKNGTVPSKYGYLISEFEIGAIVVCIDDEPVLINRGGRLDNQDSLNHVEYTAKGLGMNPKRLDYYRRVAGSSTEYVASLDNDSKIRKFRHVYIGSSK